jgi:POT family proton-dependent oligopeptide transporter
METTLRNKHDKDIFLISGSMLFERIAYYGLRSITFFYLLDILQNSTEEATSFYGILAYVSSVAGLIGGLLCDFLIPKKRMVQFSLSLQLLGVLVLLLPVPFFTHIGLLIIFFASGSNKVSSLSYVGEKYQRKKRLFPSALAIHYTGINLGAFIGAFLISLIFDENGFKTAIAVVGFFILCSITLASFIGKGNSPKDIRFIRKKESSYVWLIILSLFSLGAFWISYEAVSKNEFDYRMILEQSIEGLASAYSMVTGLLLVLLFISFALIWRFQKTNKIIGIVIGLALLIIAMMLAGSLHYSESESIPLILLIILIINCSETFHAIFCHSIIHKYLPAKLFGTVIGASSIFFFLSAKIYSLSTSHSNQNEDFELYLGMLVTLQFLIGFIIFYAFRKKKKSIKAV